MNDTSSAETTRVSFTRDEVMSALFVGMVMQQSNMALMLLGKMPNPETGQALHDLEGAKMFIDQLEMLEVKTKGNLDDQEARLLKQSLTAVRLAFVDAVEHPLPEHAGAASEPFPTPPPSAEATATGEPTGEGSHKKFSKKY